MRGLVIVLRLATIVVPLRHGCAARCADVNCESDNRSSRRQLAARSILSGPYSRRQKVGFGDFRP